MLGGYWVVPVLVPGGNYHECLHDIHLYHHHFGFVGGHHHQHNICQWDSCQQDAWGWDGGRKVCAIVLHVSSTSVTVSILSMACCVLVSSVIVSTVTIKRLVWAMDALVSVLVLVVVKALGRQPLLCFIKVAVVVVCWSFLLGVGVMELVRLGALILS